MDARWEHEFRQRIADFSASRDSESGYAVSIKVRVSSGCFHREHSPNAYSEIDKHLGKHSVDRDQLSFEEHESGPEILVYLAVTTAGLVLAKSVLDLVTAILQARKTGIKKGDRPSAPLEVIIRGYNNKDEYEQEVILRVDPNSPVDPEVVRKAIEGALRKLPAPPVQEKPAKKRK